ncbi:MAG: transaldolase, partial [Anaerolineae bacterium]|nr:transaldolase [Anaerolineae bacterium]
VITEATQANAWGWIVGATTNPVLLGKSEYPPEETLRRLAQIVPGIVYYQLTATDQAGMLTEAERASRLLGEKAGFKIMPTLDGLAVCAKLCEDFPCAITAVYSPAQAMAADAAGADFIIVYYHKLLEQAPEAKQTIRQIADCLLYSECELMAASIRSPEEAVAARLDGFPHLTIPMAVLKQMVESPFSAEAGANFSQNGVGV